MTFQLTSCLAVLLAACSSPSSEVRVPADATSESDYDSGMAAEQMDSGMQVETSVVGRLDGQDHLLEHALLVFEPPLYVLCLSDVELTEQTCGYSADIPRVLFLGKFAMSEEQAVWAFPQVEFRQIPAGPLEFSFEGTLEFETFDIDAMRAAGELSVAFDSGTVEGVFAIQ